MKSKIMISTDVCNDDVVRFLASRYRCEPQEIISRFLEQERYIRAQHESAPGHALFEENEMAILRDMHIYPTEIEFV